MLKRVFDVVAALVLGGALIPLFLLVVITLWLTQGRPVLFTQVRPGLSGKPFRIIKFRTMTSAVDSAGDELPDSERLTRTGRLLRATSIDELPELWNIMRGEMSFVGPRPLLMEYLPLYSSEQARRHEVRPGLTGWAQVNGRNALSWQERLELDVWYVDNQSFLLDMKILGRTAAKVLTRDGISQPGQATMKRFEGND